MEFLLRREDATPTRTIGQLTLEGHFLAFTLEDPVRDGPKVPGETAIPAGRYELVISQSVRFGRLMSLLKKVPGFTGIRFHGGNRTTDTAGCPLVGLHRVGLDEIADAAPALNAFHALLADAVSSGERCWVTIMDPLPEGTLRA